MIFQNLLNNFRKKICNYQEYEKEIKLLQTQRNSFIDEVDKLKRDTFQTDTLIGALKRQIEVNEALIKEYEAQFEGLNPVDKYCMAKGYEINNFVYKDKVIIGSARIPCNLREMITPNSFVVENIRNKLTKIRFKDKILWYTQIMHDVANLIEWSSDGREDNYYYPAYTLTTGRGDCEDISFAQCSIEPELGTAFGFYIDENKNRVGHAFAVGVVEGELWIFDGTPDVSLKYEGNKRYTINYIITQKNIYVIDGGVTFGSILWG